MMGRAVFGRIVVCALLPAVVACGDDPVAVLDCTTDPRPSGLEVIEQVQFDASLNVDLSQMTQLASGVYIQDIIAGDGATLVDGSGVTVNYTGWLSNGCVFDANQLNFLYPDPNFIEGWTLGMAGQQVGSTRRIIMPPALALQFGSGPLAANST